MTRPARSCSWSGVSTRLCWRCSGRGCFQAQPQPSAAGSGNLSPDSSVQPAPCSVSGVEQAFYVSVNIFLLLFAYVAQPATIALNPHMGHKLKVLDIPVCNNYQASFDFPWVD